MRLYTHERLFCSACERQLICDTPYQWMKSKQIFAMKVKLTHSEEIKWSPKIKRKSTYKMCDKCWNDSNGCFVVLVVTVYHAIYQLCKIYTSIYDRQQKQTRHTCRTTMASVYCNDMFNQDFVSLQNNCV